jgi:hypothetical protein
MRAAVAARAGKPPTCGFCQRDDLTLTRHQSSLHEKFSCRANRLLLRRSTLIGIEQNCSTMIVRSSPYFAVALSRLGDDVAKQPANPRRIFDCALFLRTEDVGRTIAHFGKRQQIFSQGSASDASSVHPSRHRGWTKAGGNTAEQRLILY